MQAIKVKDAYGAASYWNGHIFFTDRSDTTRDFAMNNGLLVMKGGHGANVVSWGNTDRFG